ncbi:hypothetical protein [Fictibacillus sp. KU28468]|uniref:hypothetical protein n=1 Tax=Fictibacillus sp. KU28468 TaxID=2991053 RepID=UPI00223D98CD|nr:hypothetical protein [Fictibacillus sp. KU28468]UZJ80870.1 hypothetical protein OKX00_10680 [Fictibacillus sp. KU28468]
MELLQISTLFVLRCKSEAAESLGAEAGSRNAETAVQTPQALEFLSIKRFLFSAKERSDSRVWPLKQDQERLKPLVRDESWWNFYKSARS